MMTKEIKTVQDAKEDILLPFQTKLMERIDIAEEELNDGGNSHGILLLGESGSGKSYIFDRLALRYSPRMDGHQRITPFVRYTSSAGTDFSSICRGLLEALGASPSASTQVKANNLEDALRDALIEHKTAVVALEEVHNALTNEGKQFRSRMRNFLKNLWNFSPADDSLEWASASPGKFQRKLIVLVSGTSALKKVFEDDDELRTRYNNIVIANRLSISSPEEFKAFRMILIRFAIRFRLAMEYDFKSDEFAMRCYLGTGANMRAVERLFERAGTLSRRLRTSKQSVEQIFSSALKQVDESQSAIFDPFLETINIVKNTFSMELNRQEAAGEGLRK